MLSLGNAVEVFRSNIAWALAVNLPIALIAYAAGVVRGTGLVAGILCGVVIYSFGGSAAFLLLFFFFVMGSVASKVGLAEKKHAGVAEERGGARGAGSVFGKCTVGVIVSLVIAMEGGVENAALAPWLGLAYAGAFAAALADTWSSELGPVYGGSAILLTTFKRVQHGTPGAVSLSGTAFALTGGLVVALLANATGFISLRAVVYVTASSFGAGVVESFIRAFWKERTAVAKQASNAVLTFVGAFGAVLLGLAFHN